MRLCALPLIALLSACVSGSGLTPDPPSTRYPSRHPSTYERHQSNPLNDISRDARSVRGIIGSITGIHRDLQRVR